LIQGEETKSIVNFLRQNPNTTIDKVAKHLQQEKICSRLTTLSVIEKLLVVGLIKDDRRGKYFHSLSYNEDFDFRDLASTMLKRDVKENLRTFDKFVFIDYPTEEQVKELHNYLDEAITEYYRRLGYYESDQLYCFPPVPTKKKGKKGNKSY
jgi:predicted transcriptional regulator